MGRLRPGQKQRIHPPDRLSLGRGHGLRLRHAQALYHPGVRRRRRLAHRQRYLLQGIGQRIPPVGLRGLQLHARGRKRGRGERPLCPAVRAEPAAQGDRRQLLLSAIDRDGGLQRRSPDPCRGQDGCRTGLRTVGCFKRHHRRRRSGGSREGRQQRGNRGWRGGL